MVIAGVYGSATTGILSTAVSGFQMVSLTCSDPDFVDRARDVGLEFSDDHGRTWSDPIAQNLGALGQYKTSVQWRRLGYSRNRIFRLTWSVDVPTALSGIFADVSAET